MLPHFLEASHCILSNSRKACAKKISETSFSPALKGRSVIMGLKAHASTGMGLRSHASNSRELIRFGHSGSLRDSGYQALSYSTADGGCATRASLRANLGRVAGHLFSGCI